MSAKRALLVAIPVSRESESEFNMFQLILGFCSTCVIMLEIRVFYSPTDVQESCFKNIKIYIKTDPTCFGLITIIGERII
jgi:hypothetical protein